MPTLPLAMLCPCGRVPLGAPRTTPSGSSYRTHSITCWGSQSITVPAVVPANPTLVYEGTKRLLLPLHALLRHLVPRGLLLGRPYNTGTLCPISSRGKSGICPVPSLPEAPAVTCPAPSATQRHGRDLPSLPRPFSADVPDAFSSLLGHRGALSRP